MMNRYLSKKYRLCYFDHVASGYSNCSQLKYISLCSTCILSEKVAFCKMGKPFSKRKGLSKLSAGNSAPPQQLSVCQVDHFTDSQATCQKYHSPSHLLVEAISFHFYSLTLAVLTLLKWRLVLCNQAVETCYGYLLNWEKAHALTTLGEKILCARMSATHSSVNRPTSLQRELGIHLMLQLPDFTYESLG